MSIACGIVGLPNVGKSTLFNALTSAHIAAENYPFCTIEPNHGIVSVPDPRLQALADLVKPEKIVPAAVEFVDIAGLVAGASKGEGLGNQFLAHIRETDAIAHVVRCFEDDKIVHVSGSVDPLRDIATIETELMLADIASLGKQRDKASRAAKAGVKEEILRHQVIEKIFHHLDSGQPARTLSWSEAEIPMVRELHLITAKPVLYVANTAEAEHEDNKHVTQVRALAAQQGAQCVTLCANLEAELMALEERDRETFLKELGLQEPGLHRVIRAAYQLLGLQTFFTAGPKEVRAWTVATGATAPQAAGVIHTDFERGFIRAEVIGFDDYLTAKSEQKARESGRLRLEGKQYQVHDGDVIHFRFNV